jgi:LCP family protein required for cell wall assembly
MVDTDPSSKPVRRRGRLTTALLAIAGTLSLVIAGASGLAIATIHHVESSIDKIQTGQAAKDAVANGTLDPKKALTQIDPVCVRRACTYLILGSDSREGLPGQFGNTQNSPGQRSDTMILVQTDPEKGRTVVLSIPRDLWVEIPGHGMGKINTAIGYGNDVVVQAVHNLTGLKINHFVEVNFLGFEGLVDAMGGVTICTDRPLVDQQAGLNLQKPGCHDLKGGQALAFVRARHIEGDLIPDFSRIARQQQFMRAVIQKALSLNLLLHLPDLINTVSSNLQMDDHLNLYNLQDLTRKLAEKGQSGVTFRVVPALPKEEAGVDYVVLSQPDADRLFERMRNGGKLGNLGQRAYGTPVSPANVTVQVLDAGNASAAAQVATFLEGAGFLVLPTQAAPSDLTTSEILWGPSIKREDQTAGDPVATLSSYLPKFNVKFDDANATGTTLVVVVGPDFPGIEA